MQEFIGNYIMMEEYFMRQMVIKVSLISDVDIEWCDRDGT